MKRTKGEEGFTLVEIMVVVVILALLAGIILPKIMGRPEEARRTAANVQMKEVEAGLNLFKIDNGFYPSTEQGLQALVTKPTIGEQPKNYKVGGYLHKVPKDPWGNEFLYLSPGEHGEFDLVSYGADGVEGGEGKNADVESWNVN